MNVDRQRVMFSKRAAEELDVKEEVIRKDLGRVFLQLETLRNEQIQKALIPKEEEVQLSPEEKAAALELLQDPNLLDRILEICPLRRRGRGNKQERRIPGFCIAAAGCAAGRDGAIEFRRRKKLLMEAMLALMPEEQRVQYSAMTGQSLFYMGETDLKNKILAIVEEEGATTGRLCSEATAERRGANDRLHRQRSDNGKTRDASIPGRRSGDDLPDNDRHRDR